MSASENPIMQHVDYEEWVAEERAKKHNPTTVATHEMYPVMKIPEMSVQESPEESEELMLLGGPTAPVDREIRISKEERSRRRKTICSCGHSEGSHDTGAGLVSCQTGKMWCTCRHHFEVLEVDDARHFKFASTGSGPRHALTKGIRSLQKAGKQAKLLVKKVCQHCSNPTPLLIPVMFNREKMPTHSGGVATLLLCDVCVEAMRIGMPYEDPS